MQDAAAEPRDVGRYIREWRQRRRMTQLGLALDADTPEFEEADMALRAVCS